MRFFYLLALLSALTAASQPKHLKVTLDPVTFSDSVAGERRFYIHYSIRNLTSQKLSFFLKPKDITPNVSGSMSNAPYYKIYQDNESLDTAGILDTAMDHDVPNRLARYPGIDSADKQVREAALKKYLSEEYNMHADSVMVKTEDGITYVDASSLKKGYGPLMEEVCTLGPGEIKEVRLTMLWDKQRYFTHDEHEYYIDEKGPHFLEITLNLIKAPFKDRLSPEEYKKIMDDPNFISGVYVSDKAEIDFRE